MNVCPLYLDIFFIKINTELRGTLHLSTDVRQTKEVWREEKLLQVLLDFETGGKSQVYSGYC